MPLETATNISQLDPLNPLATDPIAASDDHIRLIKQTLKNTFPNVTAPVTASQVTLERVVPVGGIILWSGATTAIPTGWAICDGLNGTPDLRDRFVVGAGATYAVGNTGGASSVTLTSAQLPSHAHTITITGSTEEAGLHGHNITDSGHSHSVDQIPSTYNVSDGEVDGSTQATGYDRALITRGTQLAYTGISINSGGTHRHGISLSGTSSAVGSGNSIENRPPYYALAYIMRTL